MATLTAVTPSLNAGTALGATSAAGGGDQFANTGKEFVYVKNGSGAAITVTFDSPTTCDFNLAANAAHDSTSSNNVGAGAEKLFGPFPTTRFNDTNGMVQIVYSSATSVTVSVIKPA